MKAQKRIIVLLIMLFSVSYIFADERPCNSNQSKSADTLSLLNLLNLEQFRGLSYQEFVKLYPDYWIYSMDYDNNRLPRRIMKAPDNWKVTINCLTFKNLLVVFLDNKVDQIVVSSEINDKNNSAIKDLVIRTIELFNGRMLIENDKKIVAELNDKYNTKFECIFPLNYYEPDANISITMR